MSDENKKLRTPEPDVDLNGMSAIPVAEIGAAAAQLSDVRVAEPDAAAEARASTPEASAEDSHLPPLPTRPEPSRPPMQPVQSETEVHWVRRLSAVLLVLMTSGFAGFLTGAAGGILLLTGALDIDSAWIKDTVNFFRGK